ncbi:hypothetical protein BDV96DRAFT_654617 [Lophiotrema nucula]|uniref:Uncharacterized protein n=1 Tax=Lophiotrema nucula TaxID=690887 RepID=A0A6A5YKD3_9PLEO|nr:hypothetical protein BDV96DRAFT_654617 [Lophiotrema nucula]
MTAYNRAITQSFYASAAAAGLAFGLLVVALGVFATGYIVYGLLYYFVDIYQRRRIRPPVDPYRLEPEIDRAPRLGWNDDNVNADLQLEANSREKVETSV